MLRFELLFRFGGIMTKKYWVPAMERAQDVLDLITRAPGILKMAEINKKLDISKSTLFNLLLTLEELRWIEKDQQEHYCPGMKLGMWGNSYFQQFDLVQLFVKEAAAVKESLNESIQLAKLEGENVLYLAKADAPSKVQMVSGPGSRMPAHATGLGKMLLSSLDKESIDRLYPERVLPQLTPYTLGTKEELIDHLATIKNQGYALDLEEGVMGFRCVAAPIYDVTGTMIAAVSVSIPLHNWDQKRNQAENEITLLSKRLSMSLD
jgi:DNA-binding IclR family transcriptional regulator